MKKDHSCKHPHNITQTHHRICHAEWKMFDDVHPQDRAGTIAETTTDKLPIGKQSDEILPGKREIACLGKSVFHQHLPS
jgi:hypothetical protein